MSGSRITREIRQAFLVYSCAALSSQALYALDPNRTLDTFYEVSLAHDVATVDDAVPLLKWALTLEKAVAHGR